jgi:Ca2+-binding RTX toxin-like protein
MEVGTIGGEASGVTVTALEETVIVNDGLIAGQTFHGINISGAGATARITNKGFIIGTSTGVSFTPANGTDHFLTNSGAIRGDYAVYLNSIDSHLTFVNSGITDRIGVGLGSITFTNTATGVVASVMGGGTVDTVTNNGTVSEHVDLGGGNDKYSGSGKTPVVFGGNGNDTLTGGSFADWLSGETDNDTIIGGLGKDRLTGGTGNDTFRFTAKTHSKVGAQADVIDDFDDFGFTGDRIDVSALFGPRMTYMHTAKFTAAGQVRINDIAGPDLIVEVNTGGSLAADFAVRLKDTTLASMNAGDFIL